MSFNCGSLKQSLLFIFSLLLGTDVAILLNLPVLRQILGFLFFTLFPGVLIILILKLQKLSFLKKLVLSVGLSISFLMASGLVLNSFYPLLLRPLSFYPILICLNILVILLIVLAFLRNRKDIENNTTTNFDLTNQLLSPLLFTFLFPVLSVLGIYLMDMMGNNIVLLGTLFFIPLFVIILMLLKNKVYSPTYPVALLMIGMAITLMYGLRGNNVLIGDVSVELNTYHTVLANGHWNPLTLFDNFNACLPVTILPVIFRHLLNTDVFIYKLFYPLIHSVTPVVAFIIFRKYLDERRAFLAAFLILSIFPFSPLLSAQVMRQIFGFLFFGLAVEVLFDTEILGKNKYLLLGIMVVAMIVSHYTTALIFAGLLLVYTMIDTANKFRKGERPKQAIFIPIILFLFILIFLWFTVIAKAPFFHMAIAFTEKSILNLSNFAENLKSQRLLLSGSKQIPDKITLLFYLMPIVIIGIGIISLILQSLRRQRPYLDDEYLGLMFISAGILGITFILDFYAAYDPYRMYLQFLLFLSPAFILGIDSIAKRIGGIVAFIWTFLNSILWIHAKSIGELAEDLIWAILLVVVLGGQYFAGTYMVYQLGGTAYSEVLNNDGTRYDRDFVHDAELSSASWLFCHNSNHLSVWGDYYGNFKLAQIDVPSSGYAKMNIGDIPAGNVAAIQIVHEGYIYLGYANLAKDLVYPSPSTQENASGINISDLPYLFFGVNLIYNNGKSTIYH